MNTVRCVLCFFYTFAIQKLAYTNHCFMFATTSLLVCKLNQNEATTSHRHAPMKTTGKSVSKLTRKWICCYAVQQLQKFLVFLFFPIHTQRQVFQIIPAELHFWKARRLKLPDQHSSMSQCIRNLYNGVKWYHDQYS